MVSYEFFVKNLSVFGSQLLVCVIIVVFYITDLGFQWTAVYYHHYVVVMVCRLSVICMQRSN